MDPSIGQILFFLNGSPISLDASTIHPDSTLLDFIRSQGPGLTGTKLGCGEGGCGACTVVIQSIHPLSRQVHHLAVNACLAPIISVDGKHVITVEGLGNSLNPHPLQERLWKMSGSQCGFCTPGIVMSIYALLRNAAYRGQLTVADVELEGALDGNLCRCTGYKTILDSAKTFVGEYLSKKDVTDEDFIVPVNYLAANLEESQVTSSDCSAIAKGTHSNPSPEFNTDALANARKPKGCGRADCCQLTPSSKHPHFPRFNLRPYKPHAPSELIFPPALSKHTYKLLKFGSSERVWLRPVSLSQLLEIMDFFGQGGNGYKEGNGVKLVGGSSEIQIEVKVKAAEYPVSVYVADIPDLYTLHLPSPEEEKYELRFGANLPLSELESACKSLSFTLPTQSSGPINAIRTQLRYFAGFQVRNVASVAGNIITASPISDLNPVWMACGAKVVVRSLRGGERILDIGAEESQGGERFFCGYRKTRVGKEEVVLSVVLPLHDPKSEEREVVKSYKQAKRRDDDIAIVTSCLNMRIDPSGIIVHAKFAYGGMAAWTISTPKTQGVLIGKPFSYPTLRIALEVLGAEIDLPYDVPGGMASFRKTLALSFLFKFWNAVSVDLAIPLEDHSGLSVSGMRTPDDVVGSIHRAASRGQRDNSDPYAQETVGKQEPHLSGLKHATGEAVYVDDMPQTQNEAYGALVLSTHAHAKIISVDASSALAMKGVYGYVSHSDLPSPKANWWGTVLLDEVFFAVDEVVAFGQPIGMIVAQTKIIAQKAARLVKVIYENLGTSILTIEQAVERCSFHTQYKRRIARGEEIGSAIESAEYVLEGTTRIGGQEHFYLETMVALAIPKHESGEMEVFSSSQDLTACQQWVAQVTGVPRNRVVARGKRMGGGFGGKETRSSHLSAIVALAAKRLKRPVRCMLDRSEDIQTTGQRHPFLVRWKVGFNSQGKILALDADLYANAGHSLDISGGVMDRALAHVENCLYIPNVDVRGWCCKTNTVSNTAFRGFGGPQGMAVAEHYVEAIAHKLDLDIDHVRQINLYKEGEKTPYHQKVLDWHVPRLLEDCRTSSNYDRRRADVDRFNEEHKWRKRGICLVPTKFGGSTHLAFGVKAMNQGAALVHIYLDGSVLVAHGGTEMGQGLYTKCCQIAAQELRVPLEAVFTSESSTAIVPNTVPTAGSASSDLQGYAVHNACAELNQRLQPYREKLGDDASMADLAAAAWGDRISLSVTGFFKAPGLGYEWNNLEESGNLFMYFTQGVAATEVEVDTLTGDHTVLHVDIHMDVGKSLNPAIDYGQIEGAFTQGQGWATIEESLWLQNGAIFTQGPGAYKIPGFSDIPQTFNVSLLKDAEWPNLGSIKASKGIGEPPLFLGISVALAIRYALRSARKDAGIVEMQEFRLPLTSERIRMAAGDFLAKQGTVEEKYGSKGSFFVHI